MEITNNITKKAFIWTAIFRAPFWAMYNLLLFILYKDLKASPFEIALFIALKPGVALFSMYWSAYVNKRPDRLLGNLIWGGAIGYLPFLFLPLFPTAPFVLFASALFMMMHRGILPAWMEILKLNLPTEKHKVFAWGSVLSNALGCVLPLIIGPVLDLHPTSWRLLFVISAALGIFASVFQWKIPISLPALPQPTVALKSHLLKPWKDSWQLLKENKGFRHYLIGFMVFGGSGLMIMQPVLPKFFVDVLNLSYTELSVALTLCKGVGFALASPLWAKAMPKTNFFRFSALITLLAALFPLILLAAEWQVLWIYVAYLLYGIFQGGSELVWHLSGPFFASQEDSSPYSGVNVLIVGIRGLFIPQLGTLLGLYCAPSTLLLGGTLLCALGGVWMALARAKKAPQGAFF